MSGPAPKPTALKKLAGNPGHRKLNDTEPKFVPSLPQCPAHLKSEARREWKRVVQELFDVGLLTSVDRGALAAYCQAWARWVEAEKHLRPVVVETKDEETGAVTKESVDRMVLTTEKGYQYPNPWIGIANSALDLMRKFMSEFGMTPASRSRIRVEKPQEADPFEEWAKKKLEEEA